MHQCIHQLVWWPILARAGDLRSAFALISGDFDSSLQGESEFVVQVENCSICTLIPVGVGLSVPILILDCSIIDFPIINFPIEKLWIPLEGAKLIHTYSNFDECLGNSEHRYFGEGYLRVARAVSAVQIDLEEKKFAGTAHIEHSGSWSRKGEEEQEAHLSSVDAILLAWHLCETFIRHEFALDTTELGNAWVNDLTVRAGAQPLTDLQAFTISGSLVRVNGTEAATSGSTYRCTIGPLIVDLSVKHHISAQRSPLKPTPTLAERRECPMPFPTNVRLSTVAVDTDQSTSSATFHVTEPRAQAEAGLEAAYSSGISIVDAVVLVAQLAQVYLYTIDDLNRADSNTLWMRRIHVAISTPVRAPDGEVTVTIHADNPKTLDMRSAGTWRLSDFVLHNYCGISGKTSVAHQLTHADSLTGEQQ